MKDNNAGMIPVMIGEQTILHVPAGTNPGDIHCAGGGGGAVGAYSGNLVCGGGKASFGFKPGCGGGSIDFGINRAYGGCGGKI